MLFKDPFPYAVIDDYLTTETVSAINEEWPHDGWHKENGKGQIKWNQPRVTPTAQKVIDAVNLSQIESITGINGLIADPELSGAGLHCIPSGGFLKMHCDFNTHRNGWHRRVNMLVYLNEKWRDTWGGYLQLGLDDPALIAPVGGRCVIFETNDQSWHGHPHPLTCPENIQRRSLAMYFYTPEPPAEMPHTTRYIK